MTTTYEKSESQPQVQKKSDGRETAKSPTRQAVGAVSGYSSQQLMLKPADPGSRGIEDLPPHMHAQVLDMDDEELEAFLGSLDPAELAASGGKGSVDSVPTTTHGAAVQRKASSARRVQMSKGATATAMPAKVDTADKADRTYETPEGSLYAKDDKGKNLPPSLADISQGGLNDCYLLSVLGGLVNAGPANITNMLTDHGSNTYTVAFRGMGSQSVTARFQQGAHANVTARKALWPLVIEKAYAQSKGQGPEVYSGGGNAGVLAEDVMGGGTTRFNPGDKTEQYTINKAKKAKDDGAVCTALTPSRDAASAEQKTLADEASVIFWHWYTVVDVDSRGNRIKLFNPHGRNHPRTTGWLSAADFKKLYHEMDINGGSGGGGSWV